MRKPPVTPRPSVLKLQATSLVAYLALARTSALPLLPDLAKTAGKQLGDLQKTLAEISETLRDASESGRTGKLFDGPKGRTARHDEH